MSAKPAYNGYFADPFLLRVDTGYVAYGSSAPFTAAGTSFQALRSPDLRTWHPAGTVLTCDPSIGTDIWAPEVVHIDDGYWMYYSAGFGITGHHLRVAHALTALGPFTDCGVNLTPDEAFAIDPHPFRDTDGSWYLYFAHDVLEADRPGTHLAVRRMQSMTHLDGQTVPVLAPNAPWQLYEAQRHMYGRHTDWYTLEGPTVVERNGNYTLLYSGGSWEGPDYGVSYATAPTPLGPWRHASTDRPLVLSRELTGQSGPGHNSVLQMDDAAYITAYHAWDTAGRVRQMYLAELSWHGEHPRVQPTCRSNSPSDLVLDSATQTATELDHPAERDVSGFATLKDVAARAGVSYQTASRVLNHHANVLPATRDRVQAAIDALHYTPNEAARALRATRATPSS